MAARIFWPLQPFPVPDGPILELRMLVGDALIFQPGIQLGEALYPRLGSEHLVAQIANLVLDLTFLPPRGSRCRPLVRSDGASTSAESDDYSGAPCRRRSLRPPSSCYGMDASHQPSFRQAVRQGLKERCERCGSYLRRGDASDDAFCSGEVAGSAEPSIPTSCRERLISQRTALINHTRGLLAEYGVVLPQGPWRFAMQAPTAIADADLSDLAREIFGELYNRPEGREARREGGRHLSRK